MSPTFYDAHRFKPPPAKIWHSPLFCWAALIPLLPLIWSCSTQQPDDSALTTRSHSTNPSFAAKILAEPPLHPITSRPLERPPTLSEHYNSSSLSAPPFQSSLLSSALPASSLRYLLPASYSTPILPRALHFLRRPLSLKSVLILSGFALFIQRLLHISPPEPDFGFSTLPTDHLAPRPPRPPRPDLPPSLIPIPAETPKNAPRLFPAIPRLTRIFLTQVLSRHRNFNAPGFLQNLGPTTLLRFLNYLDSDKSLFLAKDINHLYKKYSHNWLVDIFTHQDYKSIFHIWDLRQLRIRQAMDYINSLKELGDDAPSLDPNHHYALIRDQPSYAPNINQWKKRLHEIYGIMQLLSTTIHQHHAPTAATQMLWSFDTLKIQFLYSLSEANVLDYFLQSISLNFGDASWVKSQHNFRHHRESSGTNFSMSPDPSSSGFFIDHHDGFPRVRSVRGFFKRNQIMKKGDRVVGFHLYTQDENSMPRFFPLWPFPSHYRSTRFFRKAEQLHEQTPGSLMSLLILRRDDQQPHQAQLIDIPLVSYDSRDQLPKRKKQAETHKNTAALKRPAKPPHPSFSHAQTSSPTTSEGLKKPNQHQKLASIHSVFNQDPRQRGTTMPQKKTVIIKIPRFFLSFSSSASNRIFACIEESCHRYQLLYAFLHELTKATFSSRKTHLFIVDLRGTEGSDYHLASMMLAPLFSRTIQPLRTGPSAFFASTERQLLSGELDQEHQQHFSKGYLDALAQVRPYLARIPLVVLVDHHTSAAAEYWAEEIRLRRRGLIVGSPHTAGEVGIREHYMLKDRHLYPTSAADPHALISLEVEKIYTSAGKVLPPSGIAADYVLPHLSDYLYERDSLNSLFPHNAAPPTASNPPPLAFAVENMRPPQILKALASWLRKVPHHNHLLGEFLEARSRRQAEPLSSLSFDPQQLSYIPILPQVMAELEDSSAPSPLFLEHYTFPLSSKFHNIDFSLALAHLLGMHYSRMLQDYRSSSSDP